MAMLARERSLIRFSRRAQVGRRRWLIIPLCAAAAAAVLAALYPAGAQRGRLVDRVSGEPIQDARVVSGEYELMTTWDGRFVLPSVKPGHAVTAVADGYRPGTARVGLGAELVMHLEPRSVQLSVVDSETGMGLDAALRTTARVEAHTKGHYSVSPASLELAVEVSAGGYQDVLVFPKSQNLVRVELAPRLAGSVRDALGKPVSGAVVIANGQVSRVRPDGSFEIASKPQNGSLRVLAPGYRRQIEAFHGPHSLDIRLTPHVAKGMYLSLAGAGHEPLMRQVLKLLETTELNTLVIDVKDDFGRLLYKSTVPVARQIGADGSAVMGDPKRFLGEMAQRGVYTVARIVVFKDDRLARYGHQAGLDVAVRDLHSGAVWVDLEASGWVDPFLESVWEYNVALAREAADLGFDEVQFDYVRFPTDPGQGMAVERAAYRRASTEANRTQALREFLSRARNALRLAGAYLSIDTYGYTSFFDDDLGIGQDVRLLAKEVDYVSPMLYPSTFQAGLPSDLAYPQVLQYPYDVVYQGSRQASLRLDGSGALLRPWLQYFDDYPWATGMAYNASQVEAQIRAAEAAGALGWLLWDPTNEYGRGGLRPSGQN